MEVTKRIPVITVSQLAPGDVIEINHRSGGVSIANKWYERNWEVVRVYRMHVLLKGYKHVGTGYIVGEHLLGQSAIEYVYVNKLI